ncbi:DUF1778 domain-containing protein [Gemmata sp. SH-PL17]|uniref:type II toxin-antitoxin system TacA family antitoxin n=1 Tax=Gemmata sp. SH-PL17 TaxID=1630693 RepID=UPI0009EE6D76
MAPQSQTQASENVGEVGRIPTSVTSLSKADWSLFLSLLDNPPPPNASLKKAFARRKQRLKSKPSAE